MAILRKFGMRVLGCWLLVGTIWGQTSPSAPMVRDAYSVRAGNVIRSARLRGYLNLVVCKAEYDAWAQPQHPRPDLALYMDGILMKGVTAQAPIELKDSPTDDQRSKVRAECAAANPATASEKAAEDAEADAKAASEKVAQEKDPTKIDAEKKDAAEKAAAAKTGRATADAAAQTATALDVLPFYLPADLVSKADPKDNPWLQLLQRPWNSGPLTVSIGPTTGQWPSEATIPFERVNVWWLIGWAVLFVFAIVLFVKYARTSGIIRDTGALPAGVTGKKSFSLARTQMALWTFLVAGALVFIFLVTWNENTLTNGVLALIGISSGTTLLAATADGTNPTPQVSQGFFTDLLTDGTDVSFHRYQMVLFTFILAVIFIVKVASNLVMPEFDSTLLGLMGISNGTYLGFKLQGR
jgi:hypothetical protein